MPLPPPPEPDGILVSVVVPAYNAEPWLAETLRSACSQSLENIEILVVDDGSTDGTAAIAETFSSRDPRVRLIRRENGGVGAARNTGIREARGRYIAPLDADDLWHPDKLRLQVECMENGGSGMAFAYCWSEKIDTEGRFLTACFSSDAEGEVLLPLIVRNFVGSASVPMLRASILAETGGYLERQEQGGAQGCEDWDLSLRLARKYSAGLVRQALVGYRQVPGCMSLDAASMSRSYEVAMDRARERNPEVPRHVFRESAGIFYSYLVSKCCVAGDHGGCLRSVAKAVAAQPKLLANRRLRRMALKSLIRLLLAYLEKGGRGSARRAAGGMSGKVALRTPAR